MREILGTPTLETAFTILAPARMMPAYSESRPTMKPFTSWMNRRGMRCWWQSRMNRADLLALST